MRDTNLTAIQGGLNRLRTKGAALKDSLYDLLNGYVTTEKTVKVRPGTSREANLTSGTHGLVSFNGKFHVFASSTVVGLPPEYELNLLQAPDEEPLVRVHFAKPLLGSLYVVGEFDDGDIYHFWLRGNTEWAADTVYEFNELVLPSTTTGFVYQAKRAGAANPLWASGVERTVGDLVEPTTANGFYFEVNTTVGTNLVSGDVEPDWADAVEGQLFTESPDYTPPNTTPRTPTDPPDTILPPANRDRYGDDRYRDGELP